MKFVQQIRFSTKDIDAVRKLTSDYDSSAAPGSPQGWVLQNRDKQGQYVVSVVFDSYEQAMKNNDRPETQQMAKRMGELVQGISYENFDLIEEI
jgi:hypothetical protein